MRVKLAAAQKVIKRLTKDVASEQCGYTVVKFPKQCLHYGVVAADVSGPSLLYIFMILGLSKMEKHENVG